VIALDSSAIVAIALQEPEASSFALLIARHDCVVGRPTVLESHMVLRDRSGADGVAVLDRLLAHRTMRVIDFDQRHLAIARSAFDVFGKGQGHPAQLNFGDCMSYAVAKAHGVPLLFKGDDFSKTDIADVAP
jgi:ribonuclease VapC